jgi:hypothetical protein
MTIYRTPLSRQYLSSILPIANDIFTSQRRVQHMRASVLQNKSQAQGSKQLPNTKTKKKKNQVTRQANSKENADVSTTQSAP